VKCVNAERQFRGGSGGLPVRPTLRTWKRDLERAGIPYVTEYGQADRKSLRKTFCTHLKEVGVDIRDAQELMRHSDINLTANIYTDVRMANLKGAVGRLSAAPELRGGKNLGPTWGPNFSATDETSSDNLKHGKAG